MERRKAFSTLASFTIGALAGTAFLITPVLAAAEDATPSPTASATGSSAKKSHHHKKSSTDKKCSGEKGCGGKK